jgi:predicted nucleic acid-binding protein
MKSVYIETSIFSYLTARPSANLVSAARQRLTCDWWDNCKSRFDLFISPLVELEASRGDPAAAQRRLSAMEGLPSLEIIPEVAELTSLLLREGALPPKAEDDAAHVSLAAVHGIDYLLTWNCRHIDNAEMKPVIRSVCAVYGSPCPEICTPEELLGDFDYER